MLALENMIIQERAILLHQLFPNEMPALIQYMYDMAEAIQELKEANRKAWRNDKISFDQWLSMIAIAKDQIYNYQELLIADAEIFGLQLFADSVFPFTVYCALTQILTIAQPNPQFATAVNLLLNNYPLMP